MDVFSLDLKEILFTCSCGWVGDESNLDYTHNFNMACCPKCKNDDVRVLNDIDKVD